MYYKESDSSKFNPSNMIVHITQNTTFPYSITVNTKSHILILFKYGKLFKTFPIAVGKSSTPTPRGHYKIVNKAVNPGGPYGVRWLGLNIPDGGYGIHGTNNNSSIGNSVSHGCIRMFNKDVVVLYNLVQPGTSVDII